MSRSNIIVGGHFEQFGTAVTKSYNVGSGANRKAIMLSGYTASVGSGGGTPSGASVGSDTLSVLTSGTIGGSSLPMAVYALNLTVSGVQNCVANFSGGPFGAGFGIFNLFILQGSVGALTLANLTAIAETALGSAGSSTKSVTSASGDDVYKLIFDLLQTASPTATDGNMVTNDQSPLTYTQFRAGLAGSSPIDTSWNGAASLYDVAFTITEAGGAGGSAGLSGSALTPAAGSTSPSFSIGL